MIMQAPQTVRFALFQGTPLWEASLWAKIFRRSVAERARLPQGTAMQGGRCAQADSLRRFRDNQDPISDPFVIVVSFVVQKALLERANTRGLPQC